MSVRFSLDPGDVLGDGCWEAIKRVLVVISTLWVGCLAALLAYCFTELVGAVIDGAWSDLGEMIVDMGGMIVWSFLWAPVVIIFSVWGLFLLPLLGLVMYLVFRAERQIIWTWFGIVVVVGCVAMEGLDTLPATYRLTGVLWVSFLLILAVIAVMCWYYQSWQGNVHAQHLMEVHAENEQRRMEMRERFGTKSFGQSHVDADDESGA